MVAITILGVVVVVVVVVAVQDAKFQVPMTI